MQRDLRKLAGLAVDRTAVAEHQVERRDGALLHVRCREVAARIRVGRAHSGSGERGRHVAAVGQRDIRAVLQQRLHRLDVHRLCRANQRRRPQRQHRIQAAIVTGGPQRRRHLQLRIRIGPLLEQQPHDLDRQRLVERRLVRAAAVRECHIVNGQIQRRAAPPVPTVDVGAAGDQVLRHVEARVPDCPHQRRHALGIGKIDRRALLDHRRHTVQAAFARREHQRRHASRRPRLRTRLGADQRRHQVGGRSCVQLRVHLDQQPRHRPLAVRRRPHQRRLPALRLPRPGIRALFEQHLRRGHVGPTGHQHQRCLPVGSSRVRVGAGVEQRLDDLRVRMERRLQERRGVELVPDVRIRAGLQQLLDLRHIVVAGGHQQGRRAARVDDVGRERRGGRCSHGDQPHGEQRGSQQWPEHG